MSGLNAGCLMARLVAAVIGLLTLMNGASARAQPGPTAADGLAAPIASAIAQQPGAAAEGTERDTPRSKAGTAAIRGRVFAADSGQPLRKAQVRLTLTDDGRRGGRFENQIAATDAAGRYEFTNLPAGRYRLTAVKGSYVSLEFGQRRPFESGKPLEVPDGQALEKVDFTLPRGGVITGHVLDEFGEPSANVYVSPMRYRFDRNGRRRLTSVGGASTNDLGEFRIFALAPGEYCLSATLHNELGDTNERSAYAPIYYPGTPDPELAGRLTVATGQTVSDLSFTLLPVRTVRVSGTAVDSEGRPLPGILLVEPSRSRVFTMPDHSTLVHEDGAFTVGGLTPGEYRFLVRGIPILGSRESLDAMADVIVGGDDVMGVRLVAGKPLTATGHLVVTDPRAAQSLQPSMLRVVAFPVDEMLGAISDGDMPPAVNDDWSFQLKLRPGRTRLAVFGAREWDVKAVRFGGVDVTDAGIDVNPSEDLTTIEIELTNRVTEAAGLVADQRGEPVKDYSVVIFSHDRRRWESPSRSVRTARSDQEGRFKISGLPPGEYFACAIDDIEPDQESDLDFLARIQTLAMRFSLADGERKTLNLKLNTVP
jgi:uncharacterized protein (DUF2141 family)